MKRVIWVAILLMPNAAFAQDAAGIGGMGGSTLAQWVFTNFAGPALQQASTGIVANVLTIVAPFLSVFTSLIVFIMAKRAIFGALSMDELIGRAIRLGIVFALCTPAVFNNRISQHVLNDIPTAIASTGNGEPAKNVAAAYDAQLNAVTQFSARLRAQATSPIYIPEKIIIWLAGLIAKLFITLNMFVFVCATVAVAFALPFAALLAWTLVFDALSDFGMAAIGKLVSLFLVMASSVWLGAFVAKQTGTYMQNYMQLVTATPPTDQFRLNAGDSIFSSLGIISEVGALAPTTTQGNTQATANVAAGIEALLNMVSVVAFGFFVMSIMVGMALTIGGRVGGFSMRGPVNVATKAAQIAARRMR